MRGAWTWYPLLNVRGSLQKRVGSYYTLKEHDSVRIKNRRTWSSIRIPQSMEGHNGDTIEFLKQFCGMDFRGSVIYLLNEAGYRYEDKEFESDTYRKRHECRKAEQETEPEEKGGICAPRGE